MRGKASIRPSEGNVAVTLALSLTTLLGFAAVTIDISYGRVVQQQLQNASEAAARAGTMKLDGTDEGLVEARATAIAVAAMNNAGGGPVAVAPTDVTLGSWNDTTSTFVPSEDPAVVDTVEVRARVGGLDLFVSPVAFGRNTAPVSAETRVKVEKGGATAVSCFLPLAIPSCILDREGVDGIQDLTLKLNPAGVDNVGWGRPNGHPNASWAKDQIGDCEAEGEVRIGDPVGLTNGVLSSAISELDTEIEASSTRWSTTKWGALPTRPSNSRIATAKYGNTYEGPILVFDGGPGYCTGAGGAFNHDEPLVAFLWAAVYDIAGTGANTNLSVRIDTSSEYNYGTEGGEGTNYGVTFNGRPRLVRGD
jgi:hypothetical protein